MARVSFSYIDDALGLIGQGEDGLPVPIWRHFHWGLYEGPDVGDDSVERYHAAAEAMTRHIVQAAGVGDRSRVLDVGCGFGGTLDLIRSDRRGCRLFGVNIDERQLQAAQRLLGVGPGPGPGERGGPPGGGRPISFVTADGCRLPVADRSLDHVLAVECLFHFPSRKAFFREAARVLRPGGTVALSDFVAAPGAVGGLLKVAAQQREAAPDAGWYGHSSVPLTVPGYDRIARVSGFDLVADDDVTRRTLPTYAALRRMHRESLALGGASGPLGDLSAAANDVLESLMIRGDLGYHVLAFRRREA